MSVLLISSDEVQFPVSVAVAKCSGLLDSMIEDSPSTEPIPLLGVHSNVLKKILAFCEHSLEEPLPEIEKPIRSDTFERIPTWYNTFVSIHHTELFQLVEGANYMDVGPLMDLTCAKIASMIKDKTVEEIRATFDLQNDFTPEEEAAFREEMRWCEDC